MRSAWWRCMIYLFSPFCRNKGFFPRIRQIICSNHPKGQKQKHQKTSPKIWFKHMIYIPLPFCRKKRFLTKRTQCVIYLCLSPKKGQVGHRLPLWLVAVYDLPGPFLGQFFGALLLWLFLLFLLLLFCCYCCCFCCCYCCCSCCC